MVGKSTSVSRKRGVNQWSNGNPLEALKDLTSQFRRELKDDLIKGTASDILEETEELLGLKPRKKISGTLSPQEPLDLTSLEAVAQQQEAAAVENRQARPEMAFRPQPENFIFLKNERAIGQEIEALLLEIKKEVKRFDEATKNLESEVARVVVEEIPPNPGIYHVNFFEWLLGLLRDIRQRVENASTWLSVIQSKKSKRGYWSQFKKHGTSFGLSSERVVATQTG